MTRSLLRERDFTECSSDFVISSRESERKNAYGRDSSLCKRSLMMEVSWAGVEDRGMSRDGPAGLASADWN